MSRMTFSFQDLSPTQADARIPARSGSQHTAATAWVDVAINCGIDRGLDRQKVNRYVQRVGERRSRGEYRGDQR
jgi:hypothetical protein